MMFTRFSYRAEQLLTGIIFLHRITDVRMTGSSARILSLFIKLCGQQQLRNVLIVTTRWGDVAHNVGIAREEELKANYFQPLLSKGAQMVRHENNTAVGARQIMENFLSSKKLGRPMALQIQIELVENGKRLSETEAGEEVTLGLTEQMKKYEHDSVILSKSIEGSDLRLFASPCLLSIFLCAIYCLSRRSPQVGSGVTQRA